MPQELRREDMLRSMPIVPLLFRLSLPATVAMFINALYNFVDTIFVGQGIGALGIGALSITFPLQMVIAAVGLMFGVGGASMASRFLGAGRIEDANHTMGSAIGLVVSIGVVSFVGLWIFLDPVLSLLGATPEILPYAREYSSVILLGLIPLSMAMTGNNLIRAEGNAKMSMLVMLAGAVTNIILDPIFIFVLDMGVRGAAIATIIGQYLSAIWAYAYLFSPKSMYKITLRDLIPKRRLIPELAALGLPNLVRNVGGSVLLITINNIIRNISADPSIMIAVMGVVNRLMMFSVMPIFGIVQGMQPIAGFNYGAKQYARVREVIRASNIGTFAISMVFFLIFMLMPGGLMRMFADDPRLISLGSKYLRIIFLMMPLVPLQIVSAVYFQALGKALPSLLLSTSRQFTILLPLAVLFSSLWGITGLVWAFPLADLLATAASLTWYRAHSRHLFTLQSAV